MSEHTVLVPFAGYVFVTLDSEEENEERLIELAMEESNIKIVCKGDTEVGEWDVFDKLVEGNVVYTSLWKAEVMQ